MRENSQTTPLLLIFGGSGFIGSRVVSCAQKKGIPAVSFSRKDQIFFHNHERLKLKIGPFDLLDSQLAWVGGLEHFIRDKCASRELQVVNCAGVFNEKPLHREAPTSLNELITANVLLACKMLGVRHLVHLSSSSFYASSQSRRGIKEEEVFENEILGSYALAKWRSEKLIIETQKKNPDLRTVILRPQLVYGPGENLFLPKLIQKASSIGLPQTSSLGPLVDMTHVDNLIQIISSALEYQPSESLSVFNVSDASPVYLLHEIRKICEISQLPYRTFPISKKRLFQISRAQDAVLNIGRFFSSRNLLKEPSFGPIEASVLSTDRTLDLSKAFWLLNYAPQISTPEGLELFARESIFKKERP